MPTLILPPRHTPDATALWRAALAAGWRAERLGSLREVPAVADRRVAVYGETLFAAVAAGRLGLALLEPPPDFLTHLPQSLRRREVRYMTLAQARGLAGPAFVKPADDKCFPAGVHGAGADLPAAGDLPDAVPVLVSEVVRWEREFR